MQDLVEKLSILLAERQWTISLAESCTGGLIAAAITHRPGSSEIFDRGFVTYSNAAKTQMLNVSFDTLEMHGAVSEETAHAMANGALENSQSNIAIAVTGIAGPDGGNEDKPVGLVYIGYAVKDGESGHVRFNFEGTREQVRAKTAQESLRQAIKILERQ